MTLPALSLAVVGADHPNKDGSNRRFLIGLCAPGDPVELRLEPKNKHDPQAIAVFSDRGGQLGYLPAERSPRIGQLIRQGVEVRAVFQTASERGAWIRVAFDGEEPVLPVELETIAGGEADFWPDPEWWE